MSRTTSRPTRSPTASTARCVVNVAWRALLGPSTTLRQQTSVTRHRFFNREQGGRLSDGGGNEEIAYRADLARAMPRGLFEAARAWAAGPSMTFRERAMRRRCPRRRGSGPDMRTLRGACSPSLTISPGVRVTTVTHVPRPSSHTGCSRNG